MQLDAPFIRLPLRFDAERLAAEVADLGEDVWQPHPQGNPGNSALPLISANGDPADEATRGAMLPTPHLARLPYLRQVLSSFDTVLGRSRLMRIEGDGEAKAHVDINHYWFDRARIHVPIVTSPGVRFLCGDAETHMAAGETWIFDTWRAHNVLNPADFSRIHLVADTVGSPAFWSLVDRGTRVHGNERLAVGDGELVPWREGFAPELQLERVNRASTMTPWELEHLLAIVLDGVPRDEAGTAVRAVARRVTRGWRALWAMHGDAADARGAFIALTEEARSTLATYRGAVTAPNGQDATRLLGSVLETAVERAEDGPRPAAATPPRPAHAISRPVFIVSPPRSGSTLLFETLAQSPDLWTIGGESHGAIEGIDALHPAAHGWESNALAAADATPAVVRALEQRFLGAVRDRDGRAPSPGAPITLLEKTPKNALRIPFLRAAFPDARFVFLYRDPMDTMASMVEGWRSGRFATYPNLPGWEGPPWSFLLVPGWRELAGLPAPELVARQWKTATDVLLDDLEALPPDQWCVASYGQLVHEPQQEIERLCEFLDIRWDRTLTAPLPPSKTTLTAPDPEKSRRNAAQLQDVLPIVGETTARARAVFARPPGPPRPTATAATEGAGPPREQPMTDAEAAASAALAKEGGFRSAATRSFGRLLDSLGASLVISTYQSGRLIVLRQHEGELNTHFCAFDSPMGIAVAPGRLVFGTRRHIWDYRDQPAVGRKLDPPGRYDACYLPRSSHITGDVRIHEVVLIDGEPWFVNTQFSCLATVDDTHSFVPRWRPPFISALAPEDRCHLNGVATVDGAIRYVSALGMSDDARGWRENKTAGGVILEVPSGEPVATGLCMPHSPRWHDGALWILESGKGTLARVDSTGTPKTIATMPGFTRGLAFVGPYAFVGLSQVRETLFEGVPVKERDDRACGVWVIDTRDGSTAAYLRFEGVVQEIFDIQVLPHRFPELGEPQSELVAGAFVLPTDALAQVPEELRATN
jgi:uncharacterized protein (TIGR03032 family)